MKKYFIGIICALFVAQVYVAPVYAASLIVQWEDPTPKSAAYLPGYYVEYKVADGATGETKSKATVKANETNINSQITAVAGDVVTVRMRASNMAVPTYPVSGEWSGWYTASPVVTPLGQTPIFTVIAY